MIKSIKHKGLRLLWEKGDTSKLPADQITKIELRLEVIDSAKQVPQDFGAFPGWKTHKLSGGIIKTIGVFGCRVITGLFFNGTDKTL